MIYIYILKLQSNKYYIGKTLNPKFRLNSHFNNYGSAWTKKYKPIKVITIIKNCDNFDEDKYTLKYMEKYGINNVRGGSFCQIKLSNENNTTIEKMINGTSDKCYICGIKGHYANNCQDDSDDEVWSCEYCDKEFDSEKGANFHEIRYCKKKNKYKEYYSNDCSPDSNCYRCGRKGHYSNNCYAKKHRKGYILRQI